MVIKEESRLQFAFSDDSKVIKFDDTVYYRNLFNVLPDSKGVDFILVKDDSIAFIEVKNCSGDEGNNRQRIFPNNQKKDTSHTVVDIEKRESLDIEIPKKVAMTLAALAGAKSFGVNKPSLDELQEIIAGILDNALADDSKKKYVILVLEGNFGGKTRTKKMIMSELQRSMNVKMRWLNCKVSVVDSDTYDKRLFQIMQQE